LTSLTTAIFSVALLLLIPSGARPAASVNPGEVKVVGGMRGFIDTTAGEQADIRLWPTGPGEITVRIYDLRGRLVREIRRSCPGGHAESVTWDGTDSRGARVAPGGYPLRVTAPGINFRAKLGVLR